MNTSQRPSYPLASYLLLVVAALFVAWLRLRHMVDFVEWPDEIWSLWHVRGTFSEAMSRIPFDWPPLFSLLAWAWMQIVGHTLEAFRFIMILIAVMGSLCLYRAAILFNQLFIPLRQDARQTAFITLVTFAGMGYPVFTGVEVRAYGLLLFLGPLTLWMLLRWLRQPHLWSRSALVALLMAAMFYSSFTSLLFIAYLCAFVLIQRPRLLRLWLRVGLMTLLFILPVLPQFAASAGRRIDTMVQALNPFVPTMLELYQLYSGTRLLAGVLALCLLLLALVALRQRQHGPLLMLLLLWVSAPAFDYLLLQNREFLMPRYLWWVVLGMALLPGVALLYLPRLARLGLPFGMAALALLPVDFSQYRSIPTEAVPMRHVLSWLADHIRPGDVLIKDPYCVCGDAMAWDYFMPQYFPEGYLPLVDSPGEHPRVWYLATSGWQQDEALIEELLDGRKASIFAGPWNFLVRLYEGPPGREGVAFGDSIQLNGFEIEDNRATFAENEQLKLKLWWSTATPLDFDYSISLALLDRSGNLVAQTDGPAQAADTPAQTSQWQPGVYYEDYRTLQLPPVLAPDDHYQLVVTVYDWRSGQRLPPHDNPNWALSLNQPGYLILRDIKVISY